jgi:hypothetical protein
MKPGIYRVKDSGDFVVQEGDPEVERPKIYRAPTYDLDYLKRAYRGQLVFMGQVEMPPDAKEWG